MRMFALLAAVIPILSVGRAPAAEPNTVLHRSNDASFDVDCKTAGASFRLHFQSKSGDVSNDDMSIMLRQDNKEIALPLKRGWYKPAGFIRDLKKLPRICRLTTAQSYDYDYPAIEVGRSQLLIFFNSDGRPGFSRDSVVLYDTKARKVLQIKEDIANLKDGNMAFRSVNNGVEQRLIRSWLDNTGCDCAETAIEDWNLIHVVNGNIVLGWVASRF